MTFFYCTLGVSDIQLVACKFNFLFWVGDEIVAKQPTVMTATTSEEISLTPTLYEKLDVSNQALSSYYLKPNQFYFLYTNQINLSTVTHRLTEEESARYNGKTN